MRAVSKMELVLSSRKVLLGLVARDGRVLMVRISVGPSWNSTMGDTPVVSV